MNLCYSTSELLDVVRKLLDNGLSENPRSYTQKFSWKSNHFFLKTSSLDLYSEYQALLLANRLGSVGSVSAIPLVLYDKSLNVLITKYVSGESLFNFLWNRTYLWKIIWNKRFDFSPIICNIGRWLNSFHYQTISEASIDNFLLKIYDNFSRRVSILERDDNTFLQKKDYFVLRIFFDNLLESVLYASEKIALLHGDFVHSNILVSNKQIFICDFADAHKGLVLEDVVRFWCSLWEISETSYFRKTILSKCLNLFLEAYGFSSSIISSSLFLLLRVFNSIIKLLEFLSLKKSSIFSFRTKRIFYALAKKHALWLRNQIL